MPKVSIIVPMYGVENFIERCARSLFEQTLDDIEYLFIDDCSPDRSVAILKNILDEYPHRKNQVHIHRMEKNSGQAAVRRWGMLNASGDYIIHCDSDDWADFNLYEAMYSMAKENDSDVVVCDYRVTTGSSLLKQIKGCSDTKIEKYIQNLLFQRDSWALWNKMFKKTVCSKDLQFPEGNMGEDMVLCLQMMFRCDNMSYLPNHYYYYYYNKNSISNKRDVNRHIRNYEQLKSNTDLLIEILKRKKIPHLKWVINAFQYNATINLLNLIHYDRTYYNLWKNTYPSVNKAFIFNPFVKFEQRIKCLLALLGFYPLKKDRI